MTFTERVWEKEVMQAKMKNALNIKLSFVKAQLCVYIHFPCGVCAVLSNQLKLNCEPQREKLNYHLMSLRTKPAPLQVEIGYWFLELLL